MPVRCVYRLDSASLLTLRGSAVMWVVVQDNDGFHCHNAKEDRTFIFVAGAEQFVDRNKLRHRQSKRGTELINIFAKSQFD